MKLLIGRLSKTGKGILTTKEKADSAYQQIVGVESRDPSVVHWQEGSAVTVRVFPVLSQGSRKFKIGITSPLSEYGGHIKYKSIYFEGPDFSEATEQTNVRFMQTPQYVDIPSFLSKENEHVYSQKGKYRNNWEIRMGKTPIESNGFCFNGNQYSIKTADNEIRPVHLLDVYLDLNSAWTKDEFDAVYDCCKSRNIWVKQSSQMVKVTRQNRDKIFSSMSRLNFSLFPLFEIQDPEHSILISKSTFASPNMSDLEKTDFLNSLIHSHSNGKVYFFNLGEELSPYLKTLLEFRKFNYQQGEISDLKEILLTNSFSTAKERDDHLIIHQSNISIQKNSKECITSNAPDHIMRMFAYNHILRNYIDSQTSLDSVLSKQIIHEAQESYVVSPISSLIVLETQNDYDRFGISDIEKSIGNAAIQEEKKAPLGDLSIWEYLIMGTLSILTVYLLRRKKAI